MSLTATAIPGKGADGESTASGAASGLYNTALQVGGALGIAALATVATARTDVMLSQGVSAAQAVTTGRDLALVVAAVTLLAGAALALRMPAAAGRSTETDSTAP